jgi:hypothetical protein
MTRDEILTMAQEASIAAAQHVKEPGFNIIGFYKEHFARAVYAKAIKDAEEVCSRLEDRWYHAYRHGDLGNPLSGRADPNVQGNADGAAECASAIRALGKESLTEEKSH